MPCFKGLAVSIHTPDGPIPEYGVQKQSRASRISSYIPVPPAKVPSGSLTGKPEQSTFAISITLLTPGLNIPYSTPAPTESNPYPSPRVVGGLPIFGSEQRYGQTIIPYIPRTSNPNETVAAYIYFDGRIKEEVATLLRRGEETWVNSRWVSVPDSEGGGLAEREFLFREVGLERWLNGLDLQGNKDDRAERVEKRQRRLEKRRQKLKDRMAALDEGRQKKGYSLSRNNKDGSPAEDLAQHEAFFSSDSDSDDEPPLPEAAGQIKVALFRVLASGEVKRGEYSPQFDAHDDDDGMENGEANGQHGDGEIDHTTSFAKPKTLDPKTISTQTVTGLDPPEQPYATFTFFYRGEKQLGKMGILPTSEATKTPSSNDRKSSGPDFSTLGPLKSTGTVGFSGYRDSAGIKRKSKSKDTDAMDSDADDEDDEKANGNDDTEEKQDDGTLLSPEDARRQGEIAEGVQKIKLKRQHSAEPMADSSASRKSPFTKTEDSPSGDTPRSIHSTSATAGTPPDGASPKHKEPSEAIGSPFKRHRASMPGEMNNSILGSIDASGVDNPIPSSSTAGDSKPSEVGRQQQTAPPQQADPGILKTTMDSDEEL